jgi:chromosome segregation ATPase
MAIDNTKSQIDELTNDQNRLRQNIDSLNNVKGQEDQVRQYSTQLATNEASLAKLRDQHSAAAQRKATLDAELKTAISQLSF